VRRYRLSANGASVFDQDQAGPWGQCQQQAHGRVVPGGREGKGIVMSAGALCM
jgi:hypothetical protein